MVPAQGGKLLGVVARPRVVELALLAVMAVPALAQKLWHLGTYSMGPDGSLYMDVAQHLIAGDGLVTSLSLYHQGYPTLPHPTSVQPLWPLLLAAAGKLGSLPAAAVALPTLLWVVALALAFLWGRRVAPTILPTWRGRGAPEHLVHGGHLAFALLALTSAFAMYTSRPYTEGLSFALLFGCLLRAPTLFARRTLLAGAELGLWLALLFYARSQNVVVVLAAPCAFAWQLARERARWRETARFAVASSAVFAIAFAPELWWVSRFVEGSALQVYLRFDQSGAGSALGDLSGLRAGGTLIETLRDRVGGVAVAFGPEGYRKLFGWVIYVLPLALVALVATPRRAARELAALVDRHGLASATALGTALLLHLMHKEVGNDWWFGDRHALGGVLVFALAAFLCVRTQGLVAWLALALFVGGTAASAVEAWPHRPRRPFEPLHRRLELQARLLALDLEEPGQLVVALQQTEARQLAWLVPDVGFHGMLRQTTLSDLEYMVDELGVDYVLAFGDQRAPVLLDPDFEERFEEIDSFVAPARPSRAGRRERAFQPEDLVRVYRPRFLPGVGRGPAE